MLSEFSSIYIRNYEQGIKKKKLEMIKNKLPNIRYPVGSVPKVCFALRKLPLQKGNTCIKISQHLIQLGTELLLSFTHTIKTFVTVYVNIC